MTRTSNIKISRYIPRNTIFLSLLNMSLTLISLKNLTNFFDVHSYQSWFLLSIAGLGILSSLSIFNFNRWSFFSFHIFIIGVSVAALGQLFERPSSASYYSLLAVCAYGAVASLLLHRHVNSAYFNPMSLVPKLGLLKIKASLGAGDEILQAELIDISHTGCFLNTERQLSLGQQVHLCINIDPSLKFRAKCTVMRSSNSPNGYGLMFIGLDHRDFSSGKHAMDHIISKLYTHEPSSAQEISA